MTNLLFQDDWDRWSLYSATSSEEQEYLKEILSSPTFGTTKRAYYNDEQGRDVMSSNLTYTPLSPYNAQFTPNLFKNGVNASNTLSNLYSVKALALDVDFRKNSLFKDRTPLQVLDFMFELDIIGSIIPEPSYIEYGHQLRFIYVLETPIACGTKKQDFKTLNALLKRLCGFLNREYNFYAEPQKLNSYFRFPGSINTKDGSTVHVMNFSSVRFSFQELMEYLDALPEWYEKWKQKETVISKKNKISHIYNKYQLVNDRLLALQNIARTYAGNRYNICYVYAQHLAQIDQYDIEKVFEFNKLLPHPLKEKELVSKLHYIKKYKNWRMKNETINEKLGGTYFMTARQIEKMAKIEAGTTREQLAEKNYLRFVELRKTGLTQKAIAEKMGLALVTIKGYCKRMREENV